MEGYTIFKFNFNLFHLVNKQRIFDGGYLLLKRKRVLDSRRIKLNSNGLRVGLYISIYDLYDKISINIHNISAKHDIYLAF